MNERVLGEIAFDKWQAGRQLFYFKPMTNMIQLTCEHCLNLSVPGVHCHLLKDDPVKTFVV